jgi:predicted nucleic acid-binding protein
MRIIVSDTSCIIDLKEGAILASLFRLPFQFVIPEELFDSELLSFSEDEKLLLRALGLEARDLDGDQMTLAYGHRQANRTLTVRDCYALALAETIEDSILLTGDRNLRLRSESLSIETHGVIWALDQLVTHDCCSTEEALYALVTWRDNPAVFLPEDELHIRISKLK